MQTVTSVLSLHDALPISCDSVIQRQRRQCVNGRMVGPISHHEWRDCGADDGDLATGEAVVMDAAEPVIRIGSLDRKSTRLNSSHVAISYAVFCLKKKIRL